MHNCHFPLLLNRGWTKQLVRYFLGPNIDGVVGIYTTILRANSRGVTLRTLFWRAAKTYSECEVKESMAAIKEKDPEAFN